MVDHEWILHVVLLLNHHALELEQTACSVSGMVKGICLEELRLSLSLIVHFQVKPTSSAELHVIKHKLLTLVSANVSI